MKKVLLSIIYFVVWIFSIRAQTLYGTAFKGGNDGGGTINKFIPATNDLTVSQSFESLGLNPFYTSFIQASDGKLYGMTRFGGSNDRGVIFSYDPSSHNYKKLKNFDSSNGSDPIGSLIQASDGKIYGMTGNGGSSNAGVIFSYDPSSSSSSAAYTKLKDFNNANGANPHGSLIQASDGKLYGMTTFGGSSGLGVIFSFDPSSSTYTKLTDFNGTNGSTPYGSLMEASNGKLYGMTSMGGSSGVGVIFSFDPSSSTYTKVKDYDYTDFVRSPDGLNPYGSLIEASDGKLYGMTSSGGSNAYGVIFSYDPSSSIYKKLKEFDGTNGGIPHGSLVQATNGKLYGVLAGNPEGSVPGLIFSFDPSSLTYKPLKDISSNVQNAPVSESLLQASNGRLYGMIYTGQTGENNFYGSIFSYDPASFTYTEVKDFRSNEGGSNVAGSLLHATDGKLYGTTVNGGSSGVGVIFSFDPSSSTYVKLKDFDSANGANLSQNFYGSSSLLQAANGTLYGMTANGGRGNAGVIFSYDPPSSSYTKLKDFDYSDGAVPYGSLIQASDRKLYGMTYVGGSGSAGVIFSYDPSSSTYTSLTDFDGTNGSYPNGNLIQGSDGKLYGMTSSGGNTDSGVIFSYDLSSSTYKKLIDFGGTNGASPRGSLMQARNGKLYGMTSRGGANNSGVIFSFDPSSSTYRKLKDFDTFDPYTYPSANESGASPYGSLMQASDGKLYGMTFIGGSSGFGVIFSFDPSSSTYTKLKDYNRANGASPGLGSAFIEVKDNDNPPTVSITTPNNNATYIAPAAHIKLAATASDKDGTISKVEFYNGATLLDTETVAPYGFVWRNVPAGNYTITAKATDNSCLVTTSAAVHISVVPNKAPTVSIINPANHATYTGPANIHLEAAAKDPDGRITRVEFYNGSTLLQTEYTAPYTFIWRNVPVGNYSITAKATDNWGAVTTSAVVTVSVRPNKAPTVSITNPANGESFTSSDTILLAASAQDPDGRITRVEFYNGSTLLRTEYKLPYTYNWTGVPAGTYTITAVATDNWGAKTTSAPVTVTVTNTMIVSSKPNSTFNKTGVNAVAGLSLYPNPATNILNLYTQGLQQNKPTAILVISSSGVLMKTIQLNSKTQTMQLDISPLVKGVYTIKVINGNKVLFRRFVKL